MVKVIDLGKLRNRNSRFDKPLACITCFCEPHPGITGVIAETFHKFESVEQYAYNWKAISAGPLLRNEKDCIRRKRDSKSNDRPYLMPKKA